MKKNNIVINGEEFVLDKSHVIINGEEFVLKSSIKTPAIKAKGKNNMYNIVKNYSAVIMVLAFAIALILTLCSHYLQL